MNLPAAVEQVVRAAAPIVGLSFGALDAKSTWEIQFDPAATVEQRAAAQAAIDNFDIAAFNQTEVTAQAAEVAALTQVKADVVIQYLLTHAPAECNTYVQTNVTNLADAKNILGKFAMALSVLAKVAFR